MTVAKDYARLLYMSQELTQKEIALRVNVTEKTIGKWVIEGMWETQKISLLTSKKDQLWRLYNILSSLTYKIEETEYGDTGLADMMIKYTAAIKNLETETNIGQYFETLMSFTGWLSQQDSELAKSIIDYADTFLQEKIRQS